MSTHPDPVGAYRQAVERGEPPAKIIRAARLCRGLSLEDAMPALLATTSRSDDLFDHWAARWVERYRREFDRPADEREAALVRAALATLPGHDTTAAIAADALAPAARATGYGLRAQRRGAVDREAAVKGLHAASIARGGHPDPDIVVVTSRPTASKAIVARCSRFRVSHVQLRVASQARTPVAPVAAMAAVAMH